MCVGWGWVDRGSLRGGLSCPPALYAWGMSYRTLDDAVARLTRDGYAVEDRSESQVVMVRRRKLSLLWLIVLCVITVGLALLWVLWRMANPKFDRVVIRQLPDGKVTVSKS